MLVLSPRDKPVKNNDKAIKGDLGPNDQPVKQAPTTTTNNNTDKNGVKSGVNILCHDVIVQHSCEPCAIVLKDIGNGCVPINQKPVQQHNHSKTYQAGYQMGCTDGPD